jgi:hypothetical protein
MCVTVHSVCCCGFELKRGATVFAIIWATICLIIACLQLGLTGMYVIFFTHFHRIDQEPLKLWTELYSKLSPNGGLEPVFLLL